MKSSERVFGSGVTFGLQKCGFQPAWLSFTTDMGTSGPYRSLVTSVDAAVQLPRSCHSLQCAAFPRSRRRQRWKADFFVSRHLQLLSRVVGRSDGSIRLRSTAVGNSYIYCIVSKILSTPRLSSTNSGGHMCFYYVLIFPELGRNPNLCTPLHQRGSTSFRDCSRYLVFIDRATNGQECLSHLGPDANRRGSRSFCRSQPFWRIRWCCPCERRLNAVRKTAQPRVPPRKPVGVMGVFPGIGNDPLRLRRKHRLDD